MWNAGIKLLLLSGLLALTQARVAWSQTIDDSFKADIRNLLEATGSARLGAQAAGLMSQQLLDGLKQSQPSLPARALEVAKQVLDAEFARAFDGPDSLTDEMIAIYARYFTREDVQGLLAFYSSDLGKKAVASMPAILQEGAAAGRRWAEKQMPRILGVLQERLRAEGLIPE